MTKLVTIILTATLGLATTACTSTLDPATLITRDRVLGAKVTVDADVQRAWPARGEDATVTWLTASPGAAPERSWVLAACPAATTVGFPACSGPVFAYSEARGLEPVLKLTVPADLESSSVVVLGAICASGTPVVDEATFAASCDDGSQADQVSQHILIAHDGATNHHPDIVDAPFTLAGDAWDRSDAAGCDGLPEIAAGSKDVLLAMAFDASAREAFTVAGDPIPWREELQLSPFATAGELLQQYAYVEADDDRELSPVAVQWTPPSADEVPAEGLRVTFSFVVRDLRGGIDATTRALCVR
ncbi:MAG: hypothetical protein IPQ07_24910 [Myxococcales bacterium]|nr:hypothetical protein [Myxococcales bacterium]